MTESEYIHLLGDYVALVFHEARNVRHLVREGVIEPDPWKYLTSLPVNRDSAWKELQGLRGEARSARTSHELVKLFEDRFHVSLSQLVEMYEHRAWRGNAYGGNAWATITRLVGELVVYLDSGRFAEAQQVLDRLKSTHHNTGRLNDKLTNLDRTRS